MPAEIALEEIVPGRLAEADDAQVRGAHQQTHDWYHEHFEGNTRNTADGLSREDVVNAHLFAVQEMADRGIEHEVEMELDEASEGLRAEKVQIPGQSQDKAVDIADEPLASPQTRHDADKAMDTVGDIVLVPNFVSDVGGMVEHPDEVDDLDLVVRLADSDTTRSLLEGVQVQVRKRLDPDKQRRLHLIPAPEGPHADHRPLYDLVLRPKDGAVVEVKEGLVGEKQRSDEGETQSERAERFWEQNWWKSFPKSGKGRFVYHHHWRGLSEEETKLGEDALLNTEHSVHGDLRFQFDPRTLWGFSAFLGKTSDVRGGRDLDTLPVDDKLQGAFKFHQPIRWLTIARGKPYVSKPGEVGATAEKYSKFFEDDSGTYEVGVWREHSIEIFLHGRKLKGRYIIQYAPVGKRRIWLISKPDSDKPFADAHNVEDIVAELRRKRQRHLIWAKPGERPRLIDVAKEGKAMDGENDEVCFEEDGLDMDSESIEDDKAGRRLGKRWVEKVRAALDQLKSLMSWASYDEQREERDLVDDLRGALEGRSGFRAFKDRDGNPRWVGSSANAFQDREEEIFTTDALEEAVAHADKAGERGPLRLYHVPGADVGSCDFQAIVGRFLVESGNFDDTEVGRKAFVHFTEHPEPLGMSIGYRYRPGDRRDKTYDWLRIFERSVCPREAAANPWTEFSIAGGTKVAIDQRKREFLGRVLGEEAAQEVIMTAEQKTAELEDEDVAFKGEEAKAKPGEEEDKQNPAINQLRMLIGRVGDAGLKKQLQDVLGKLKADEDYGYPKPKPGEKMIAQVAGMTMESTDGGTTWNEVSEAGKTEPAEGTVAPDALEQLMAGAVEKAVSPLAEAIGKVQTQVSSLSESHEGRLKELERTEDEKVAKQFQARSGPAEGAATDSDGNVLDEEAAKRLKAGEEGGPAAPYLDMVAEVAGGRHG